MTDSNPYSMSRRRWLGLLPPAVAASAGGALLADGQPFATSSPGTSSSPSNLGAGVYNIREFGARGDGKSLDTASVQAAIDACHKNHGGTVLVPAGVFVVGTVEMKSNVTLHIAAEGKLLGSADGTEYRAAAGIPLHGDATLEDGNTGLIFAIDAESITIEGPGTIDGQGAQFRSPRRGVPPPSGRGGSLRPYHLLFYRCRNLKVRNIFLLNSAFHSVRIIESEFVWCEGIRIYNRVNVNNDGFHFISNQYLHVSNCDVQSEDDACALFGSCRNVTITNCTFSTRWAVFRFGGGDPENITISNCVIYETYGCPIKMQFGPESRAQNILFSNLILHEVTGPISIDLNKSSFAEGGKTPQNGFVRNITFSGIRARVVAEGKQYPDMPFPIHYRPGETRQCIVLNCVQDSFLEGVVFNDVQVKYDGGGTKEEAERQVPEIAGEYFEMGTPPAYGLYARRVRGLTLNNVRFEVVNADLRPAMVLDGVADVAVNGFSVQGNENAASVTRFVHTRDVLLSATRLLTPAAVFVQVEGSTSSGITIDGGDLSQSARVVAFKAGAIVGAVKARL